MSRRERIEQLEREIQELRGELEALRAQVATETPTAPAVIPYFWLAQPTPWRPTVTYQVTTAAAGF